VSRLVVFTDLDGTLLDSETYSFLPAREALRELRRRNVPLVLCSSKTRAEVAPLRRRLKNRHPFIVENGGGIVVPRRYFGRGSPRRIDLGRPYSEVAAALDELARRSRVRVRGFHRMTARQIAEGTGLSLAEAHLAKRREFDEPFLFLGAGEKARARFVELAKKSGFALARGGRFWHLSSGSDKGLAVRRLASLYRVAAPGRPIWSLALGDAANDLPMLRAAHRAILLPAPDGSFDRAVLRSLPGVVRGSAPGPQGWNEAVLRLLTTRHVSARLASA
jgi:mannosyl-3-phosphoglycerate phosphatase family protein